METANLVMWLTHREANIADRTSAGRYLRRAIRALDPAVPEPEWRAGERDVPVSTDRIEELSIPVEHSTPDTGFAWSVVSGSPPRDLHLQATIGMNQVSSAVKVRSRLEDPAELLGLDTAFDRLWEEFRSDLDRVHLSVGVDFLLRQRRDTVERPLPTIGWRNLLRRPAKLDQSVIELPPWVTVERDGEHLHIILGPDARSLDPERAAVIRDQLVASEYL